MEGGIGGISHRASLAAPARSRTAPSVWHAGTVASTVPGRPSGPGWYPDPVDPEAGRRWWTGTAWAEATDRVAPPLTVRAVVDRALATVRPIAAPLGVVAVIGAVAVAAAYLAATAGNGVLFGYDWFTEPPPPGVATTVATMAILALCVAIPAIGTAVFGAMAAIAAGCRSPRTAFGESGRALRNHWWWAVPAFAVAVTAAILVVPGPLVVGQFSVVAVRRLTPTTARRLVPMSTRLALGTPATALTTTVWVLGAVAARFPSPPWWGATLIVAAGLAATTAVMALTAVTATASCQAPPVTVRPPVSWMQLRRFPAPVDGIVSVVPPAEQWMPPWPPPHDGRAAGWHRDPSGAAAWRRYDGRRWTQATTSSARRALRGAAIAAVVVALVGSTAAGWWAYAGHDRPELIDDPTVVDAATVACADLRRTLARDGAEPGVQPTPEEFRAETRAIRQVENVSAVGPEVLDDDLPSAEWLADWGALADARDGSPPTAPPAPPDARPVMPIRGGEPVVRRMSGVGPVGCSVPLAVIDDFRIEPGVGDPCAGWDLRLCVRDGRAAVTDAGPGARLVAIVQHGDERSVTEMTVAPDGTASFEVPLPSAGTATAVAVETLAAWTSESDSLVVALPAP
jgi:hypothetical protein